MKVALQFHVLLILTVGFIQLGCKTSPRKPSGGGRSFEASPALERFLISHEFHRKDQHIYTRQYHSLSEAGKDLGVSMVNLFIPPNGTILTEKDERVFSLDGWYFTVLAKKGRTLDDSRTPCSVSTSLVQFR